MKVVAVSGGSKGLGAAIIQSFLDAGYRVASFSRSCTAQVESWRASHPNDFYFEEMDITSKQACAQFVKNVESEFGAIEILINNAGTADTSLLALASDESIEDLLDINLKGTFYLTRHVSRSMLSLGWGRIINISSIIGLSGYRGLSVYGATKAGLDGFTRALARELGPRNITVNSIAPGYLTTEMTDVLDEKQHRQISRRTPLGRLGVPEDVTGLVLFLTSDLANFITGQVLVVDGGISC
jgi:3-oxoacyl-[acyl-carrier protein] reductase